MSGQFFLNLANRSASKATVPLARPYLRPVFMLPAPVLPVVGASPAPPTPQKRIQASQERPSPYSRAIPGQPIADPPRRSQMPKSVPSARPLPLVSQPMPVRRVEAEQAISPAAKPTSNPPDGFPRPRRKTASPHQPQDPASMTISPRPQPDHSAEPATSPHSLPSAHHEPVLEKGDKSPMQFLAKPTSTEGQPVTEGKDKPSPAQPAMPPSFVPNRPEPHLTTTVIERIFTPEPSQPQQLQMPKSAVAGPQTPPLQADLSASIIEKTIRESPEAVDPGVPQASSNAKPQDGNPIPLEALPLTTIIARSTAAEAPSPSEAPATSSPVRIERITPASGQRPPLQPQHVPGNNTSPIQVSIGNIDLRVNPPEPTRIQFPYQRKRPQGFDSFRQRRSYLGWED